MRRAVFLDRDGTLIEDRGYLRRPEQVVFFEDTVPSLLALQRTFLLFIVTHQSGIARGITSAAEVEAVNRHVVAALARDGVTIQQVYCCPHDRSEVCRCIKPNPYHLLRAADEYGIDLTQSFSIGDHDHDVELAKRAGGTGIYVLTGHGRSHRDRLPPGTIVTEGIAEAATLALRMAAETA